MKTLIAITIGLATFAASAQETYVTNQLTVVTTLSDFNALEDAWELENYRRAKAGEPSIGKAAYGGQLCSEFLAQRATSIREGYEQELADSFSTASNTNRILMLEARDAILGE